MPRQNPYTKTWRDHRKEKEVDMTEWDQGRKNFSLGLALVVIFIVAIIS